MVYKNNPDSDKWLYRCHHTQHYDIEHKDSQHIKGKTRHPDIGFGYLTLSPKNVEITALVADV
jgi:hypothetical protein